MMYSHTLMINFPDIDECSLNATCAANAICINILGSFKCQCEEGYSGDGIRNCSCKL